MMLVITGIMRDAGRKEGWVVKEFGKEICGRGGDTMQVSCQKRPRLRSAPMVRKIGDVNEPRILP